MNHISVLISFPSALPSAREPHAEKLVGRGSPTPRALPSTREADDDERS